MVTAWDCLLQVLQSIEHLSGRPVDAHPCLSVAAADVAATAAD